MDGRLPTCTDLENKANIALKNPTENLNAFLNLLPAVRHSSDGPLQASYDEEGDVLYIQFREAASTTDSELTDDDIIVRYHGDEIIGITILHASQR